MDSILVVRLAAGRGSLSSSSSSRASAPVRSTGTRSILGETDMRSGRGGEGAVGGWICGVVGNDFRSRRDDEEKGCIRSEGGLGWRGHGELGEVARKGASDGAAFEIRKEVQPQNGVT